MTEGSHHSARGVRSVRLGADVSRALRSDPDTEELCAICFRCGLERTDSPLDHADYVAACLACGDTRVIIDARSPRSRAGAPPAGEGRRRS
jgi:hypothetical protein